MLTVIWFRTTWLLLSSINVEVDMSHWLIKSNLAFCVIASISVHDVNKFSVGYVQSGTWINPCPDGISWIQSLKKKQKKNGNKCIQ